MEKNGEELTMKVLIVNDSVGTGSVGKIVQSLYKELKFRKNECKIIFGRKNNSSIPSDDLIKVGTKINSPIHCFFSRIFGYSGLFAAPYEFDGHIFHFCKKKRSLTF